MRLGQQRLSQVRQYELVEPASDLVAGLLHSVVGLFHRQVVKAPDVVTAERRAKYEQVQAALSRFKLKGIDLVADEWPAQSAWLAHTTAGLERCAQVYAVRDAEIGLGATLSLAVHSGVHNRGEAGLYSPSKKRIFIHPDAEQSVTTVHEWMHALDHLLGSTVTGNANAYASNYNFQEQADIAHPWYPAAQAIQTMAQLLCYEPLMPELIASRKTKYRSMILEDMWAFHTKDYVHVLPESFGDPLVQPGLVQLLEQQPFTEATFEALTQQMHALLQAHAKDEGILLKDAAFTFEAVSTTLALFHTDMRYADRPALTAYSRRMCDLDGDAFYYGSNRESLAYAMERYYEDQVNALVREYKLGPGEWEHHPTLPDTLPDDWGSLLRTVLDRPPLQRTAPLARPVVSPVLCLPAPTYQATTLDFA